MDRRGRGVICILRRARHRRSHGLARSLALDRCHRAQDGRRGRQRADWDIGPQEATGPSDRGRSWLASQVFERVADRGRLERQPSPCSRPSSPAHVNSATGRSIFRASVSTPRARGRIWHRFLVDLARSESWRRNRPQAAGTRAARDGSQARPELRPRLERRRVGVRSGREGCRLRQLSWGANPTTRWPGREWGRAGAHRPRAPAPRPGPAPRPAPRPGPRAPAPRPAPRPGPAPRPAPPAPRPAPRPRAPAPRPAPRPGPAPRPAPRPRAPAPRPPRPAPRRGPAPRPRAPAPRPPRPAPRPGPAPRPRAPPRARPGPETRPGASSVDPLPVYERWK